MSAGEAKRANVAVGDRLRSACPPGELGKLAHVRALVDEVIVIRWWRPAKQRWHYECISRTALATGLWTADPTDGSSTTQS